MHVWSRNVYAGQRRLNMNDVRLTGRIFHWTLSGVCLQVSESGVHRPHVAGIHGRSYDGAYSLVLAGGYEDDVVGRVTQNLSRR